MPRIAMSPHDPDNTTGASASRQNSSTIAYGDEPLQFGALYLPDGPGPHPLVILIHGGFWHAPYRLSLMAGLAENLARRGIAAWNIEYRSVGDAGGGWPGTLLDVARAADHLEELASTYNLDLHRVVAVGHSAGGHLALWLAARPYISGTNILGSTDTEPLTLSGVVSLAGAMDLEHTWRLNLGNGAAAELLGGSPIDVPERYAVASPTALLPLGIPQVLIHGTRDDRVPLEVSQAYARKAAEAGDPVTLIELSGADHFVLIDPASAAWATTMEEIQKLLTIH
jgi:acetyl esterase/lipase